VLIRVGKAKDVVAGQMRVVDVSGTRVAVVSTDGRQFHAFDDTCTHAGCSLAEGELVGTTVTCPCHESQFDVTSGAVIRGPARMPVRSRLVEVQGDDLAVEE
jgi:nitrite reductase/ring-hydroxylating ferredoxin subunit